MWFLSLVISLNCALYATLMQQWARQYQELAQRRGAPHKRARMRAFIIDGFRRFGILARAVTPITTLLHISVCLFFIGLIAFLIPIHTTVAYTTLSCIGVFALPYASLTILPSISLQSPFGTPRSGITKRLSQRSQVLRNILDHPKYFGSTSRIFVDDVALNSPRGDATDSNGMHIFI
jgi:hypothetical protein